MSVNIDQDVLQGKWLQVKGQVKRRWGRLTDNQLDQIQGSTDELVGLLRENYGYTRARAQQAVDEFVRHLDRLTRTTH